MRSCVEKYKKITKNEAKKLHEKGETIYFMPSMANPFSPWIELVEFPPIGNFTNNINSILAYQPKELGKSVNFYIPL